MNNFTLFAINFTVPISSMLHGFCALYSYADVLSLTYQFSENTLWDVLGGVICYIPTAALQLNVIKLL